MKTSNASALRPVSAAARNHQPLADLDDLVARAARGDSRAVGDIAIAFGPLLLREAKAALGRDYEQEADDVLQDFFLALLEGVPDLLPARGRAIEWMCGGIRALAQSYLPHSRRDWDSDDALMCWEIERR
jgi:DNA-directed RNA polymerase specialized sigma24 family protein